MTSDFELAVMTSMFDVALLTSVFDLVTSMNSFVKNSLLLTVLLTVSKASLVKNKFEKLALENEHHLTFKILPLSCEKERLWTAFKIYHTY